MNVQKGGMVLKSWVPQWAREEIVGLRETLVDGWRYQRASCSDDRLSRRDLKPDRHEARLTMGYHSVEKSLSLPEPRRPFGLALRPRLVRLLSETPATSDESACRMHASDALGALDQWNEGGPIDDDVSPPLHPQSTALPREALSTFFHSRRSVRNFDASRTPAQTEIAAAVELARNTPSVCNRQGYRAHIYLDRNLISRILKIQNGATGFSQTIPALAVVTARRAMFVGPLERNQRWVDGGLFAMTLVWAMHGLGLATCMLNWSMASRTSHQLRRTAGIPDGEDVVVLIAIGYASPDARVARSGKRTVEDLAVFHPGASAPAPA